MSPHYWAHQIIGLWTWFNNSNIFNNYLPLHKLHNMHLLTKQKC